MHCTYCAMRPLLVPYFVHRYIPIPAGVQRSWSRRHYAPPPWITESLLATKVRSELLPRGWLSQGSAVRIRNCPGVGVVGRMVSAMHEQDMKHVAALIISAKLKPGALTGEWSARGGDFRVSSLVSIPIHVSFPSMYSGTAASLHLIL